MTKTITVQKVSHKDGVGAKGKWHKTGIMDAEENWYSTFNSIDVKEGADYVIDFEENNGFYNLKSINPVSVTENKVASTNRNNTIVRSVGWKSAPQFVELALKYNKTLSEVLDMGQEATNYIQEDINSQEMPF